MATCLEVITYALRLARVTASGETPSTAEQADGLVCLQSLYDHWRTNSLFGKLEDVYLEGDEPAEEGMRYYVPAGVTLTDATSEYVDADNVTRQPRDLAFYEAVTAAGAHTAKLYDRTEWVDLIGLELADDAPMSGRGVMGLAACLVTFGGFGEMFGTEPSQRQLVLAKQFLKSAVGKDGSTQDRSTGTYY